MRPPPSTLVIPWPRRPGWVQRRPECPRQTPHLPEGEEEISQTRRRLKIEAETPPSALLPGTGRVTGLQAAPGAGKAGPVGERQGSWPQERPRPPLFSSLQGSVWVARKLLCESTLCVHSLLAPTEYTRPAHSLHQSPAGLSRAGRF